MDHFNYRGDDLYAEDVLVETIVKQFGTPCYIYSRATLERHWHAFSQAFGEHPHRICYAVKANDNLGVLSILARLDSGFDIVSVGELEKVLVAGGNPDRVVFSGVGKREDEIKRALEVGIFCFNVESLPELERIQHVAQQLGEKAPIALRVNPDVDAKTHPNISTGLKDNKFGIDTAEALSIYQQAATMSHIEIKGIACHIGSQLLTLKPFLDALERVLALVDELAKNNIELTHFDLGGGLGVRYTDENPVEPTELAQALFQRLKDYNQTIIMEPGRAIAANAGMLVTKVEYIKQTPYKNFAIIDAAMNNLLRPMLYDAEHQIIPLCLHQQHPPAVYDVVGPICETTDCFAKDRELGIAADTLLAIRSTGAYGAVMSSNYNARPRIPEVMVDGNQIHVVRNRQRLEDLYTDEQVIP